MVTMERIELALEVGPIPPPTIVRLKEAGFSVYQGPHSWRVIAETAADGSREQLLDRAMTLANATPLQNFVNRLASTDSIFHASPSRRSSNCHCLGSVRISRLPIFPT